MKVIFLDFDGVLAPYGNHYVAKKFSKSCVKNFNKILKEVPEAKIVISSSWRRHGLEYVKDMLKDNGIDEKRVIGMTPEHQPSTRNRHLEEWIDEHKDIDQFVILDDESHHMDLLMKKLVKTNSWVGITETEADRAIELLK